MNYDEFEQQAREELCERTEAKFGGYQLPGGENYRELLLTLPTTDRALEDEISGVRARIEEIKVEHPMISRRPPEVAAEMDRLMDRLTDLGEQARKAEDGVFRSGHFDEPNIFAHVRFNKRTDADGKRVLFIEEIQSDWHQQGRKQGYATEPAAIEAKDVGAWANDPQERKYRVTIDGKDQGFFKGRSEAEAKQHARRLSGWQGPRRPVQEPPGTNSPSAAWCAGRRRTASTASPGRRENSRPSGMI